MRLAHKRAKRPFAAVCCWGASAWLAAGRPAALAAHLREHELPAKVVRHKQHILYLATEDRFLRYARRPRAVAKLRRELAGWEALKAHGLGQILPRTLRLDALGSGVLLDTARLRPITLDEQLAATVPIIAALAAAARPAVAGALPPTVEAGLALARSVAGGSLPATFAEEAEIRAAFARPLRIGPSHQDLHRANVMRDEGGRTVLIDLKSYAADQVLALDVLTFACKYLSAREGFNLIEQAFAAQRRGWEITELAPALAFVDLPRRLWGPIFALYCFGRMASKSSRAQRPNAAVGRLLANLLARDWRSRGAFAKTTSARSPTSTRPRSSSAALPTAGKDAKGTSRPGTDGMLRIALLLPTLGGGGAESSMLRTAESLRERGIEVDLVLCERTGPLVAQVRTDIRIIELAPAPMFLSRAYALAADPAGFRELLRPVLLARKAPHRLPYLPALVRYLRRVRPDALFAALPTPSLMAVWARRLARVTTRVTVSQRNALSETLTGSSKWRKRFLPPLLGRTYSAADAIVAVSDGVGSDLATCIGIPRERITTIYNPVVTPELFAKASEALDHPWLAEVPVILGVGALIDQKDFPTLVRAFARVRAARRCRLIILGQAKSPQLTAERQAELAALAEQLGVAEDVTLPGFVANPFAYMARAALFVLSSRYEGLPGVLIQALACGCPVVSTDCPYGPAEILDRGRYGRLVPVGDVDALATAMLATLDSPPSAEKLRERAALFSVDRAVDRYLDVLLAD